MKAITRHTLLAALLGGLSAFGVAAGLLGTSGALHGEAAAWPEPLLPGVPEVAVTPSDHLVVVKLDHLLTADNPYSVEWWQAPYMEVEVVPQQMAMPSLAEASIETIRVQALTDGEHIAWRVSWSDSTPDGNVDVSRFSDGVAIEFPLDEGALPMMGDEESKVQILYWKALWQKDIDVGFQDVQDVHPNFWSDLYWFAEGEFPYPVPEAFQNPTALQWFVAHQAGNPMAVFSRRQPVQELVAIYEEEAELQQEYGVPTYLIPGWATADLEEAKERVGQAHRDQTSQWAHPQKTGTKRMEKARRNGRKLNKRASNTSLITNEQPTVFPR